MTPIAYDETGILTIAYDVSNETGILTIAYDVSNEIGMPPHTVQVALLQVRRNEGKPMALVRDRRAERFQCPRRNEGAELLAIGVIEGVARRGERNNVLQPPLPLRQCWRIWNGAGGSGRRFVVGMVSKLLP
jgi:hypothetical protein